MKNKWIVLALLSWLGLPSFQLTALGQPVVTTLAASGVTATNAMLNGTVNPNGAVTTAYYQYGPTTNYGNIGGFLALPATNTTQTMPGFVVRSIQDAAGANWTPSSAPATNWSSIASSADGTRLAAVVSGGGIYTSTNSGATWTPTSAAIARWYSIASSADGTRLAAVQGEGGYICTSTNSGATWTTNFSAPNELWMSIASSADGTRLVAGAWQGIYTSTNSGGDWTPTSTPGVFWYAVASSADGMRLAAAANGGGISTSTNGGTTWTPTSAPATNWYSLASSADGTRLTAGVTGGGLYTSTNSGVTWLPASVTGTNWYSLASCADGTRLAAVNSGGGIYTSAGATNNLLPGTTYHYQLVGLNNAGTTAGADLTFTTASVPALNFTLAGSMQSPGGGFQLRFTNLSGLSFTVLGATNVALPLSNWTALGAPTEAPAGQYQYTDSQTTNNPRRFYRVRSP